MSEISMPRLSDTMQEGTISRWLKQPGDEVKKGDVLAEIETDKATMDLEAYESGTLEKILVQGGETVPIGQAVAVIGSGSGAQNAGAEPAQQPAQEPSPAPATARTATEEAPPAAQPEAGAPPPDAEVVKLSRVQVLIARRLTESKQTIPHFYVSSEVDMTDVLAMRQTFNASAGEDGVKVTVNDLIVKACALALEKFPEVNSSLKDDHFVRYKRINVGIAADVPSGLVVPEIGRASCRE